MRPLRIGINGFGRIGRRLFRELHSHNKLRICAINDVAPAVELTHLLKYDSVHGKLECDLRLHNEILLANGNQVNFTHYSLPEEIPWNDWNVDIVIEASGKFKSDPFKHSHLKPGVRKVILTAPPADNKIPMYIAGVSSKTVIDQSKILSCGSCTTNSAAPIIDIIDNYLGISSCYVTTVHSYTSDQRLHDSPHQDLRRSRAALLSMIPTSTGAAKALTLIFPHLSEKIGGCGIRVPVPNVSLSDITFVVEKKTDIHRLNEHLCNLSQTTLKGILGYTDEPMVSMDLLGMKESSTIDAQLTSVIGPMVKVVAWYDNESGYTSRLKDVLTHISERN